MAEVYNSCQIEEITDALIQSITDRIVKEYRPEKIILFGSHAWGHPHEDSDLDLFIIKESNLRRDHRAMEVSNLFFPRRFPMDILVYTPGEVKHNLEANDFLVKEILTKGRVLYERI